MLNTPQKNRLLMIAERARRFNNLQDCDVIEEATRMVEMSISKDQALEAIEYLISSLEFRRGDQAADDIKLLKHEFLAYESLLTAIQYKLQSAIEYFEREAHAGAAIRIM